MDWNDVRHFLALARTASVRAAGALLGVSHSTVARRVEALERELDVRLFDRHRDGYLLTDAGEQMVSGAERVECEMAALDADKLDPEREGSEARWLGSNRTRAAEALVASSSYPDLPSRTPLFAGDRPLDGRSEDAPERPENAPCEDGTSSVELVGG